MSLNFKIALQLVQDNIQFARCGIYDTRNTVGDFMNLLHKEGSFQVWIIAVCIAVTILFICCVRSMIKNRDERYQDAMWILANTLEVMHILDKEGPMTFEELNRVCDLYWWEIEEAIEALINGECITVNDKGEYQVKEDN